MPMDEMPESPALTARRLIEGSRHAVLCTAMGNGAPYGSLVAVAQDETGAPLLFLSDLAEHSENLRSDTRAALVYRQPDGPGDPLSRPRVTAVGRVQRENGQDRLAHYLARHPEAERYATFRDFNLYRMTVERAHLVAGFGRIQWIEAGALFTAS
jgi:putative heme iron utilization protein